MNRRKLLIFGSAMIAAPSAARAQQRAIPVVGYLHFATPEYRPAATAFLQGLHEKGYVEGENFAIEYRYAEGHPSSSSSLT